MSRSAKEPLTYEQYRDGIDKLQQTEGWRISRRIEHLSITAHVFETNYHELISRIEYFKSDDAMRLWDYRNVVGVIF